MNAILESYDDPDNVVFRMAMVTQWPVGAGFWLGPKTWRYDLPMAKTYAQFLGIRLSQERQLAGKLNLSAGVDLGWGVGELANPEDTTGAAIGTPPTLRASGFGASFDMRIGWGDML
jgi:hypothetical protein